MLRALLSYIPTRLPASGPELTKFTKEVLALGDWPENDSNATAVATMILHLPMDRNYVPKRYFYNTLARSVTNQIAYATMELIKQRKNAKPVEASNGQQDEATQEKMGKDS